MIEITPTISLDDSEIQIEYVRASGPGGQNVNKVSTAAQLRFDAHNSPSLSPEIKQRLEKLAGSRMTAEGVVMIEARRYRTQEQNRYDALQRLTHLIKTAAEPPKPRKPTRPTLTAKAARVGAKKKRGELKRIRRYLPEEWE